MVLSRMSAEPESRRDSIGDRRVTFYFSLTEGDSCGAQVDGEVMVSLSA